MKPSPNIKTRNKPELLSPAGDLACFISAVNAGADSVYIGLKEFNMRDSARNFSLSDLNKIQKYRKKGKNNKKIKVYLTLNTIIYDSELKKIEKIIKKVKGKVDAVICWDLSVINLCKKYKMPFHISTQASVSNSSSALFYKKLGAERIVLARELNLKQIKKISKIIEVEIFIHGAMCVSVSGRCFTSQFLHNKSANRGECRHPCRKEYKIIDEEGNELKIKNNFVMSAKDLCTLQFIEKLKQSGAVAFKIEGRNRDADYVFKTTKVYREALDNRLNEKRNRELMKELNSVYNRKFSQGFLLKSPTSDDFTNIKGSSTLSAKKIIGKVRHYFKNIRVAVIELFTDKVSSGDTLIIIGNKTGYLELKVENMEINKKKVEEAKAGQLFAVKSPLIRENDSVYILREK